MRNSPQSVTELDRDDGQDRAFDVLASYYRDALQRLQATFDDRDAVVILKDEGKIATQYVLRTFLSGLDEDVTVAHVAGHCCDATDLMRKIVSAAGFASQGMSLVDLEGVLEMFLQFQKSNCNRTVICVESLRKDDLWVLDMIGSLVERETEGQYGMLIILSGEPGFEKGSVTLASKHIDLAPFTLRQTTESIRQRVEEDGSATVGQVFQYQAIPLIHKLSSGVPDAIERLVDRSLEAAEQDGVDLVTTAVVERAFKAGLPALAAEEVSATDDTMDIREVHPPQRRLRVRLDGEVARKLALRPGHTLIGRSDLCDVKIMSTMVSRQHAMITYSKDGVTLVDLGSLNGTQVNGRKITRHELMPGDLVTLGDCEIKYLCDGAAHSEVQAAAQQSPKAH